MIIIQGRQSCLVDFMKNMFKIGLCSDANKLIPFKLGMMIDMTIFYILILGWITLTSLKVTGLQEI